MSFKVQVEPLGLSFTVQEGQSVLDAALEAKILLPYSCRGGSCSTCMAKVISGSFEAGTAPEQILMPEELEAGYSLMCQARPCSDMVIESPSATVMSDIEVRKLPSRVLSITPLIDDVMQVQLQLPASQSVFYYPGQYLNLLLKGGAERSYSMANPPNEDNTVTLHIRHMPGGLFTDSLFGATQPAIKERQVLRVELPLGTFYLREESERPIVFLASGTGFAPINAMVESLIEKGQDRKIRFYWGGRRPQDLYLAERVQQWAQHFSDFEYIPVISDAQPDDHWTGRTGFVHHAVMDDLPDLSAWEVYACGNPQMVEGARRDFIQHCQLDDEAYFSDAFTSEADKVGG
ncbi:MAG TPA: CDP-6-deoxy-delta-3,4-glucoseen reductase [Paenalcaligenes sp.]|nr:CDP-6-deoxy-delta-3,4-glucoseen reductase [Paenalcaligenes sp.]